MLRREISFGWTVQADYTYLNNTTYLKKIVYNLKRKIVKVVVETKTQFTRRIAIFNYLTH